MRKVLIILILIFYITTKCNHVYKNYSMKITSSAFQNGEVIPKQFTCEGDNYNPPLTFTDIPQNTKSLAIIVEDPDAPVGVWYHWLLYNIPPEITQIDQNAKPDKAIEGLANGGTPGYEGPCPPHPKAHRYIFTLYALDHMLQLPNDTDVPKFREAIKGHILEESTLIGVYNGPAKRAKPL
ncbi:MAG TPA: YbhB/YbcL family Raf kinase inhibitor-like protein [Candidatus Saccharimonadales bacterium]|nr:YbhB/YbcL family Raf kinase inhibitor-like protein [Candidatus Saccharimonadales bacterium]